MVRKRSKQAVAWSLFVLSAACFNPGKSLAASFESLWKEHGGTVLEGETVERSTSPVIELMELQVKGDGFKLKAKVKSPNEIVFCKLNDRKIALNDGVFSEQGYIPPDGLTLMMSCKSAQGKSAFLERRLVRENSLSDEPAILATLNPKLQIGSLNKNAVALVIGVEKYKKTPSKAEFADKDAKTFADFAHYALGVPRNNIKVLVNDKADKGEIIFQAKFWLGQSINSKSDVYIFFAGHGLASADGKQSFLIPVDGRPGVLAETAIDKDKLFEEMAQMGAASYTVFLDTCYSGVARDEQQLSSARPIGMKTLVKPYPSNFSVFSAAGSMEIARPLKEAKHGLFSYFLMLGLQGNADLDGDGAIKAAELHEYIKGRVTKSSAFEQTPELQGDAERVLVRFQ